MCVVAELGDYDPEEHLENYVSLVECLLQPTEVGTNAVAELHKTMRCCDTLLLLCTCWSKLKSGEIYNCFFFQIL